MKNVTTSTLILAAAALTFSVTSAFAQGATKLKAEIPFSFRAGGHEYPAGTYEASVIETNSSNRILKIVNKETGSAKVMLASSPAYPKNAAKKGSGARLVFQCNAVSTGCALSQVWSSYEAGMQFSTPSGKRGEPMHIAVVALRHTAAD